MRTCPSCQAQNDDTADACFTCGKALSTLVKGSVVASRYEILSPLGKGGMGIVYKAYDRELQEAVALKVLRADVGAGQEMAQRFRSEIRLARKVRHRNVCAIHEFGQEGSLLFIAMELIDGRDLKQILVREGALAPGQAYDVAAQVADGLQAIHDEGIIHRDLKTTNVMLDRRGVVRLMDFGIAKRWEAEGGEAMTGTGQILGTPEYMSPEQVQGQKLDFRSDIYSLGIVVFELFTGHVPFRGETPAATILKHLQEPPPLTGAAAAGLPAETIPILRKALAKNPVDRFPKARLVAQALRQAGASDRAASTAIPMPTATIALPPPGRSARRRAVIGLAAVALLALGTFAYRRSSLDVASPPVSRPAMPPAAGATMPTALPTTEPPRADDRRPAGPVPTPNADLERRLELERQGQRETASRVNAMLDRAEKALESQRPEEALALYDEVVKLDPSNQVARMGRLTAMNRRTASVPAPLPTPAGHSFVPGKTLAQSVETRTADAAPPGFEPGSGIAVTRSTQAAALPGLIVFDVVPASVKPGDKYTVKIVFVNGGPAPIEIRTMTVATVMNGGRSGGPVVPLTKVVAPRDRAILLSPEGVWKDEVKSWSMEAAVHTATGETYRNVLNWK